MNTVQHLFDLALTGLLTELPVQIVTAGVAGATTRAWRKRRASAEAEGETRE
ncbi:hypothetical protein HTV45_09795 [Streptomyces sp. CHD11]|uniref:hypothetical protein n=1 Tax=Streptomyces sp. CHD11 TaxID=2741325 RepID=UPI001BFC933B|nr:hypothetical protein [Streptomyces sp. CHD11]MBT3151176.1 hypothetical protein [Streptomyces sp. CHD11]